MRTCGHNDSIFDYEGIEKVCQICGFVNYSNRYAMNGSIIDTSLVRPGNLKTIDEYDIDSILIRYKQEKEGNKPASFGYYPRAADYTASGWLAREMGRPISLWEARIAGRIRSDQF